MFDKTIEELQYKIAPKKYKKIYDKTPYIVSNNIDELLEKTKILLKEIDEYKKEYPFFHFITEVILEKIHNFRIQTILYYIESTFNPTNKIKCELLKRHKYCDLDIKLIFSIITEFLKHIEETFTLRYYCAYSDKKPTFIDNFLDIFNIKRIRSRKITSKYIIEQIRHYEKESKDHKELEKIVKEVKELYKTYYLARKEYNRIKRDKSEYINNFYDSKSKRKQVVNLIKKIIETSSTVYI